jgi:hypothetical protein
MAFVTPDETPTRTPAGTPTVTPAQSPTWRVSEAYRARPVRFRELREAGGWRVKIYSIVYGSAPLDWPVYEEVLPRALASLPQPAIAPGRPGVGFAIAHQGRGVHYLVLNWWANENEYFNRVFVREFGEGTSWRLAAGDEAACVWDLEIVWFERQAYVQSVLARPDAPDLDGYLARRLDVDA